MTSFKAGVVAVVFALLASSLSSGLAMAAGLKVEGGFFTDDAGANVILRGFYRDKNGVFHILTEPKS